MYYIFSTLPLDVENIVIHTQILEAAVKKSLRLLLGRGMMSVDDSMKSIIRKTPKPFLRGFSIPN